VAGQAYLGSRFFPILAGDALLLALPLLALTWLRLRGEGQVERWAWWWLLGAAGLMAWQAFVNLAQPGVPPIAWAHYGNRSLLLGAAAAAMLVPTSPGAALRLMGLASTVALGIYLGPHLHQIVPGDSVRTFFELTHGNAMYGNVSWVVNSTAPALLAWVALRSRERIREQRTPWWVLALLALPLVAAASGILVKRGVLGLGLQPWAFMAMAGVWALAMAWWWGRGRSATSGARCWEGWIILLGVVLLFVVAVPTARRGFLLLLMLVPAWLAWDAVRLRWPRVAWWGAGVAVGGTVAAALVVLLGTDVLRHTDRAMQARAAMEAAGNVFPLGWGGYAAMQFHDTAPDNGDYIITWMKIHDHVHNEALELLLHAGWFGLIAGVGLLTMLAVRTASIADPALRTGAVVLGLGVLVPLMTDNTVFTSMGACAIGCALGVMLRAAAQAGPADGGSASPRPAIERWGRLALLPLAFASGAIALQSARVASISTTITEEVTVLDGIRDAKDVYVAKTLSNVGFVAASNAKRLDIAEQLIYAVHARLGDVPWGLEPYNYIYEKSTDPRRRARACIECLRFYPFEDRYYQLLDDLRRADPAIERDIPPRIRRRLDTLYRPAQAEPIDLAHAPATVGDAADQYVRLRALMAYGGDMTGVNDTISRLLVRYRLIPNLTKLALEAIILLPTEAAEDAARAAEGWAMSEPAPEVMAKFLNLMVRTPAQARRVMPSIRRLYRNEATLMDRALAGEQVGDVSVLVAAMVVMHSQIVTEPVEAAAPAPPPAAPASPDAAPAPAPAP
jgi:hypothetical protein